MLPLIRTVIAGISLHYHYHIRHLLSRHCYYYCSEPGQSPRHIVIFFYYHYYHYWPLRYTLNTLAIGCSPAGFHYATLILSPCLRHTFQYFPPRHAFTATPLVDHFAACHYAYAAIFVISRHYTTDIDIDIAANFVIRHTPFLSHIVIGLSPFDCHTPLPHTIYLHTLCLPLLRHAAILFSSPPYLPYALLHYWSFAQHYRLHFTPRLLAALRFATPISLSHIAGYRRSLPV